VYLLARCTVTCPYNFRGHISSINSDYQLQRWKLPSSGALYLHYRLITGPPTHGIGDRLVTVAGVWSSRRLWSSSVVVFVVCNTAHMQRNSPGGSTRRASSVTSRQGVTLYWFTTNQRFSMPCSGVFKISDHKLQIRILWRFDMLWFFKMNILNEHIILSICLIIWMQRKRKIDVIETAKVDRVNSRQINVRLLDAIRRNISKNCKQSLAQKLSDTWYKYR